MVTLSTGAGSTRPVPTYARRAGLAKVPALLVLLLLAVLVPNLPASASTTTPATAIAEVRLQKVTTHSLRVTLPSLGSGWRYTLYASTSKKPITAANMKKKKYAGRFTASSKKPRLTLELPATSEQYWYRVRATRKKAHHTSPYFRAGLRPEAPTSFAATTVERGAVRLTWKGSAATYEVEQSSEEDFASDVRSATVRGGARAFTPSDRGRHWFRVRGLNGSSAGAYSATVEATSSASGQAVRAMTYNLLSLDKDGTRAEGSERVASWSDRRRPAARVLRSADPDVVAVQEGGAYTGAERGPRQVDSLVDALDGSYALARTEAPPGEPGYFRIGSYVLYRPDVLDPVGGGGSWVLGEVGGGLRKYAAYQTFAHRHSGAMFLFVSAHLQSGGVDGDRVRRQETRELVRQAQAYAVSHGDLPVVYGGDYNSHEKHALDGPAVAMAKAGIGDARSTAQSLTNDRFNSSNVYRRIPPASGLAMDHLYVSPGIGVGAWGQALELDGEAFAGTIPSDHNPVYADLVVPS